MRSHRRDDLYLIALTALLVALCGLVVAGCVPLAPEDARLFQPPPRYLSLWREVEACSGLHGSFGRVAWYMVPGGSFPSPADGRRVLGYWAPKHIITLAGTVSGGVYADSDFVVKHEMLHDLIGHRGHPTIPFATPCHLTWESHE